MPTIKNISDVTLYLKPRKETDRGGFYCMPLRVNVPDPKNRDWELTRCPECGAECWKNPALARIVEAQGAKGVCTMCALKKGVRFSQFKGGIRS